MAKSVIICGKLFDGLGDRMLGPTEILIEGDSIVEVSGSVGRPGGANVLDLSDRTVSPGLIDTHVHSLRRRAESGSANAAVLASKSAGWTALRPAIHALWLCDMGTLDPEWPTNQPARRHRWRHDRGPSLVLRSHPDGRFQPAFVRLAASASRASRSAFRRSRLSCSVFWALA